MKRKLLLFVSVSLAFFLLAVSDVRADLLRIRLARTASQGNVTPELQEIAEVLQRNLNLPCCVLLDEKTVLYPEDRQTFMLRGYWIDLLPQGEGRVLVTVLRNRNRILQSSVRISVEAPVILGGFRPGSGKKRPPRKPPVKEEGCDLQTCLGVQPPPAMESRPPRPPVRFDPGVRHILIIERIPEEEPGREARQPIGEAPQPRREARQPIGEAPQPRGEARQPIGEP